MKNVTKLFSTLLLISATLISPNIQANAAAFNTCTYVGPWQANSATISSPASFATLPGSSSTPQILIQAIRGTDNRLYTRIASQLTVSESNWSNWQEGNGITIKTEPEVIGFQTTSGSTKIFVLTAYGTDNALYTRTSTNGTTWTNWVRGGAITLKSKPTVSHFQVYNSSTMTFDQKLVQTGHGTDNGLYTRVSTDGTSWTNWVRGGSITLASRTEQFERNGTLIQFARGTDNGLYSRYTTDATTWSTWARNSGGITILDEPSTFPGIDTDNVGTSISGKVMQFVRGTDLGIYFRNSDDGLTWTNWVRLGSLKAADKPSTALSINLGCGTNYAMRAYVMGVDKKLYAVENPNSTSTSFGFATGLNWVQDTGITLNNNISVEEHTPEYNPGILSGSVQSARGSDNRLYTRIITSTIGG